MSSDAALMLSISGLRGLVGQSLTPPVAGRYGAAVGSWLRDSTRKASPHIVVGRDSRPSGPMVEQAAVAGLLGVGCRVTTLGIASTPAVAVMIDHLKADGGMVITASHNPIQWNGIKTLRHDGVAPPAAEAQDIIERFRADRSEDVEAKPMKGVQGLADDDSSARVHVGRVLAQIDAGLIRKRKPKVVLDSVHGAGGPEGAMLLKELGVELVHLYAEPTGQFPHTPEPTAENLTGLCDAVRKHEADVGFAQDPDADRLAIVAESGRYIGEEYTLALCALRVFDRAATVRERPFQQSRERERTHGVALPDGRGSVAANLSTSRMIDDIAARFGAVCHRTSVGEANVAAAMRTRGCVFGGEGNGGVILPAVSYVRDSLVGMALVLELLAATGKKLSQLVAQIPVYSIVKDKLPIAPGMAERAVAALRGTFAGQRFDTSDGIRIDFDAEKKWVHLRPSNTEPILRIIAEAPDEPAARQLIAQCRAAIAPR